MHHFIYHFTLRFFSRSKNSRENTTQYKLHNSPFKSDLRTDFSNLNIHYSFYYLIPSFLIHYPASTTRFYSQVTLNKDHKSLVPSQSPCSETLTSVHQNPRLFFFKMSNCCFAGVRETQPGVWLFQTRERNTLFP